MRENERKTVKNASPGASRTEQNNDQEMHECLAKLKVWRIENLMSPTGMDRFTQGASSKGTDVAAQRKEAHMNRKRNHLISKRFDKHVIPVRSI